MSNLSKRALSGTLYIFLVLAGLLVDRFLFAALMLFFSCGMLHEFYRMAMGKRNPVQQVLGIVAGGCLFLLSFLVLGCGADVRILSAGVIPFAAVIASAIFLKDKADIGDFAYILGGLFYISVPLSLSNLIVFSSGTFDGTILLCFFIMVWSSDIGAYSIGLLFGQKEGRKKLAPSISPKKSWMGFYGGLAFCVISALILKEVGLAWIDWYHCVALGVVIHVAGVAGDLFESMWKRHFGVKDSGNIIPGHGGLLDRLDSSLMAIPAGVAYLVLFGIL